MMTDREFWVLFRKGWLQVLDAVEKLMQDRGWFNKRLTADFRREEKAKTASRKERDGDIGP